MREDIIVMDKEDRRRLHLIQQVIEKKASQKEIAEALELSDRQIRRIVKRIRKEGDAGVIHRLRGKKSNRKFATEIREKMLDLYRGKYAGFGPTLAAAFLDGRNSLPSDGSFLETTCRLWGNRALKNRKSLLAKTPRKNSLLLSTVSSF